MNNAYLKLFTIRFTHHYFLDEGEDVYGVDMTAEMEAINYRLYDIKDFLSIVPSKRTQTVLKNWRARYIMEKDGFTVVIKADPADSDYPFISFSDDLFFDFIITIKDNYFENYTDITITREKLVYISNATPTAAAVDSETSSPIQFVLLSEFGDPYTDMDIELSETVPANELIGAFGMIRVHLEGEGSEIDLSDGAGKFAGIQPDPDPRIVPEVELVFTNRSTVWRFKDSSDGSTLHETSGEKPLTKNGYIQIKPGPTEYPNPTADLIVYDEDTTTYYSEVFI